MKSGHDLKILINFLFRYFGSITDIEEDEMEKPHLEKLPQIAFQSIGLSGFTSCNKYHLDGKFCRISTLEQSYRLKSPP